MQLNTHGFNRLVAAIALALLALPAVATDIPLAGGSLQVNGAVAAGDAVRAGHRSASLLSAPNAAAVGVAGVALSSKNSDDGDLNYARGDSVSRALSGMLSLKYTHGNYGIAGSLQAWNDFALQDGDVPFGNSPDHYAAGQPLSDRGFAQRSKFSGVVLDELYLFGHSTLASRPLDWKLGQQVFVLGPQYSITGGLGDLTPHDYPATYRAGGDLAGSGLVPVPGLTAQWKLTPATQVDAFVETGFRPLVPFGCGTFYSQQDFVSAGCNQVMLGQGTDAASLATGMVAGRAPTQTPSNLQGGFGIEHALPSINGKLGFYAAQFDSPMFFLGAVKSARAVAPFVPGNPDGKNPQYFTSYPTDIRIFALTFQKATHGGGVSAELSYRPNQPYQYNAVDLLNAFLSNVAPTPLRAQATATAPAGIFQGYDRLKAVQLDLAGKQGLPGVLGANVVVLGGEIAYKLAPNLPSLSVARFGRPEVYGAAPLNGICPPTEGATTCSLDGYVTRTSLAYRLSVSLIYKQVFAGVDVTPSIAYGRDVSGWSADGAISAGRQLARVAVKADIRKHYTVQLLWQPIWGGAYDNLKDRGTAAIELGYRF